MSALGGNGLMDPSNAYMNSVVGVPNDGLGAEHWAQPMSEQELVDRVGPLIEWAIGTIGIDRCMFGSNFPIDKVSIDYATLISGLDALLSTRTDEDKVKFFARNAREF